MQRWLRISLITIATILPISIIIILTKRFFSQSNNNNQVTHTSTRSSSRNTNHGSQVIHNYSSSVIELPIDQRNIGFIIGRGGEKIKRIQAESDTRIRFRDQTGMPHSSEASANNFDKIAVISGRPESTQLAKSMIEKMLQERIRDEQPMEVCLKIPDWICGRVIGHRGQNIKHLQATSGARITIENPPNNTAPREKRNCIISGSPDQIRSANELIEALLERENSARAQRSGSRSYYGKPRSISTSDYLSSPTPDRDTQDYRLHYITNTDLRSGAVPLQQPPIKPPNLISMEERVYLMYFSQQVQCHLQPLPLNQEFFTSYISTVDRNAFIWIQLLDDIGMELQILIDNMTSYYTDKVENGVKNTNSVFRTNNLPPFDTESVEVTESTAVEERRKFFLEPASSPDCDEKEQIQEDPQDHPQDPNFDSEYSSDSNRQSPLDNRANEIANTPNKSLDSSSPFQPGMVVAAPFTDDNKYYRAVVDRVESEENQAYVYFLDFGDYDVCKLSMLHFLKEDFKSLPYQAILCQLNDIEVGPDGLSECAFTRLQELTSCAQWKRICVIPSKTEQSNQRNMPCIRNCPTVTLIDTNGVRDINVGQYLIQEQLVTRAEYQHTFS